MKEYIGLHYQTDNPVSIKVENGIIVEHKVLAEQKNTPHAFIAPGLIDLQINGYGGIDFNTVPIREENIIQITKMLWQEGITTYFPTVITNSDEAIESALRTIGNVCVKNPEVDRCIAGIHVEGPFISPEDGPRGAHQKDYVKSPDWELFKKWQIAASGKIKIVTLSPEWPGSIEFIRKCVKENVIVSIGHTSATTEQIQSAVAAGARMSTHLGNGAHLMLPRHPNYLWEQLAHDDLWACLIADGFHLPDSVLKVFIRTKQNHAMLVSDSVTYSGMEPGEYTSHIGGKVVLTPERKLHMAEKPQLLAGSVQMLKWGIENLVRKKLCSFEEAWEMASIRPAKFLQLPQQIGLEVGAPADFIRFSKVENQIRILQTIKNGKCLYNCNFKGGRAL